MKPYLFPFIFMLSLFACDRAEFGKASTDDRLTSDGNVTENAEENNALSGGNNGYTNGATSGSTGSRGPDLVINEAIDSFFDDFSEHGNFAYAPKSHTQIQTALSMLSNTEYDDAEYDGLSDLTSASFGSLWIDEAIQIEDLLIEKLSTIDIEVRQISLASSDSRAHINNVAREETEGYLSELIPPVEILGGEFLLTTGSFYQVAFASPFNPIKTYENTFFGARPSDRQFMVQSGNYKLIDNEEVTALALPMINGDVFIAIMPTGDLKTIEDLFSLAFIQRLLGEMNEESVEIHLPKMDFVNTFTFSDYQKIFDFENQTFSGLGEDADGSFLHQVRFILDENGVHTDSAPNEDPALAMNELRFDRPFVFAIYNPDADELELLGRLSN